MKLPSRPLALLIALLVILTAAPMALPWGQPTHRQINLEAVKLFLSQWGGKEKFVKAPLGKDALAKPLRGTALVTSSLLASGYKSAEASLSAQAWIVNGGDWADEPHLYSSVRHFYDPLALSGAAYLTDQSEFHGIYDSPAIDGRTWGLTHPENPFCFFAALSAYKAAMEVREDLPLPPAIGSPHFKTTLSLPPKDHEDQRNLHLARAYRALGESMHMLGDMTQPAHVRNDSHPADEPIETATFGDHVRQAAAAPFIDSRIRPYIASAGGTLQAPAELFHRVAFFVNETFYTLDTIYDKASKVFPNNGLKGYPSPQLSHLAVEKKKIPGFMGEREVRRFYGVFDGEKAAMIQDRLSFHWFDPDQSFLSDFDGFKEKGGRAVAAGLGRLGPFQIPHAFAAEQGRILLPLAIYGCADMIYLFFPTMELRVQYKETELEEEGDDPEALPARAVEVTAAMKHHQDKDPAWKANDLAIQYSGPGLLVVREKGVEIYKRKVLFVKGEMKQAETPEGKMGEGPLKLYIAGTNRPLKEEERFYEIKPGQEASIQVEGGGRAFEGDPWKEEKVSVTILPPRILTLELMDDATMTDHQFEAAATPEGAHTFQWDFGDGTSVEEDVRGPGENSVVSHTFKNLKPGDSLWPRVKIRDEKGRIVAEDVVSITVSKGEKRHFFENRTFWLTGSPLANDQNVQLPIVPLVLAPSISGIDGEIDPASPEGRRMAQLTEGVAKAGDYLKDQMAAEMAKMGISLTDPQMAEAMKQVLSMAGVAGSGDPVQKRPLLGSGWQREGRPVTVTLSVSLGDIPPIEMNAMNQAGKMERVIARIRVQDWLLTCGETLSSKVHGRGGRASLSWTPERGKTPESFGLDLTMFYTMDLIMADGSPWSKDGSLGYKNMSASFPVGVYFCPVKGRE